MYLEAHGLLYFLLWAADQVTWNDASRAITFEDSPWNDDRTIVTVGDGDNIVVGGSGGGPADNGELSPQLSAHIDWANPPAPSCSLDTWWSVGAVEATGS